MEQATMELEYGDRKTVPDMEFMEQHQQDMQFMDKHQLLELVYTERALVEQVFMLKVTVETHLLQMDSYK